LRAAVFEEIDDFAGYVRCAAIHAKYANPDGRVLHAILVKIAELNGMMVLGARYEALEGGEELSHAIKDDGVIVVGEGVTDD
jgi:hypothetical protein